MKTLLTASLTGFLVGAALTFFLVDGEDTGSTSAMNDKKEPLYWVAPMDSNYRRDKPGKSPMGMDLIPVYEETSRENPSPGTITISPDVVNNLGVRTAPAELRYINTEINTVGYVQYDEDRLVHVHPRVEGWIEKLYVKTAGDPVEKGQPLYTLYSPPLVNAQEEFLLALNRSNARLLAAAEDRLRALQIDDALIEGLKLNKSVRQNLTFYAPQSGVVDNLNIREGFFVQPGTTLMSVGTLENIWVVAEVFERQASLVAKDQKATMKLDYLPGRQWHGKVDYIYPALDPKTRTARVRLRFDNPDEVLKPNMFAQVTIEPKSRQQVLTVPREAVIRTGSQNRVVISLGEGRFKSVAVQIGRLDNEFAEIISGLDVGENVVVSAQFLLDSESSKTSDFMRMHHAGQQTGLNNAASAWVEASIIKLNPDQRMIKLDHGAIPQWSWPAMTMNFPVADSVDMSPLQQGMTLQLQISKTERGDYRISAIQMPDMVQGGSDSEGGMDHSGMDSWEMKQMEMKRTQMNHRSSADPGGRDKELRHD